MGIDALLSRLSGVRPGGAIGRWMARCPAHEDRSPSLAIRFEDDGRILMHCFGGCEVADVLGAVGLTFSDLFPEKLAHHISRIPRPFSPLDALQALASESAVIAIAAHDIANGFPLDEADSMRIATAAGRIATSLEVVHGL